VHHVLTVVHVWVVVTVVHVLVVVFLWWGWWGMVSSETALFLATVLEAAP